MNDVALATPANPAGMEYHKIQTLFKRDPETEHRFVIDGDFANDEFAYLKDVEWHVEEKVDGMNTRVHYEPRPEGLYVLIGGKTDNADIPAHLDRAIRLILGAEKLAGVFPNVKSVTLYGEGYGQHIHSGGFYDAAGDPEGCSFILFDVTVQTESKSHGIQNWILARDAVYDIADKLEIRHVPSLGLMSLSKIRDLVRDGFQSELSTDGRAAEGVVARPRVELRDRKGERIITKLKHKDFAREGR